jgi:OmpR family response regulator RpaB
MGARQQAKRKDWSIMFTPEDYTVLVVDDEAGIRKMLVDHLDDEGFATLSADSGLAALRLIQTECPDLLLLDAMMPGFVDGFGVLDTMRDFGSMSQTPVILVTAVADAAQVMNAIKLGVVDYVVKPFKLADVSNRAKKALQGRPPNRPRGAGVERAAGEAPAAEDTVG